MRLNNNAVIYLQKIKKKKKNAVIVSDMTILYPDTWVSYDMDRDSRPY